MLFIYRIKYFVDIGKGQVMPLLLWLQILRKQKQKNNDLNSKEL